MLFIKWRNNRWNHQGIIFNRLVIYLYMFNTILNVNIVSYYFPLPVWKRGLFSMTMQIQFVRHCCCCCCKASKKMRKPINISNSFVIPNVSELLLSQYSLIWDHPSVRTDKRENYACCAAPHFNPYERKLKQNWLLNRRWQLAHKLSESQVY